MEELIEAVPNVSEGRRPEIIQRIAQAAAGVAGARLLDVHSDADHNRSVFTIAGAPEAVAESAFRLARTVVGSIDMRQHEGVHPRIGALDVLPFVPLGTTPMEVCIQLAHQLGRRIAQDLSVPVYFYGEAALRPERRLLANIRRGEYEGLCRKIASDPDRMPDVGAASVGPAGAAAVGARRPLIAFNVYLRTGDVKIAQAVARAVRASSGGLSGVQALGLPTSLRGMAQVSMNIMEPEVAPLAAVVARVHEEARRRGVEPGESELVGLMPAAAALGAAAVALGLERLEPRQVIELALAES